MTTLLLMVLLLAAPFVISPEKAAKPQAAPDERQQSEQPEEWVAEYVEYRCLPELGQITISDGIVRGRKPVEYLRSHGKELAARGIFPCADRARRRTYRRTDTVAGRKFETVVAITPPADDGGDWTRRLTVLVDGRKKVDCSIGDSSDGEVFVYGVTVFPEDGTVEVAAVDADGAEVFPPEGLELIDNPGVITDDALEPLADDDVIRAKPLDRA